MQQPSSEVDRGNGQSVDDAHFHVEYAWRVLQAQEAWLGRIDTKASIFLTAHAAVLGVLVAFRVQAGGPLVRQIGTKQTVGDVALVLGAAALGVAAVAVFPMLGRPSDHRNSHDLIYFGHLRHRSADEVSAQLMGLEQWEAINQVARHSVAVARINWVKHRAIQVAFLLAGAAYATLAVLAALAIRP
jgi:hypothetical protein